MNLDIVKNIAKEQLRDNRRIYLDRFLLFVGSFLCALPFIYLYKINAFTLWLVLYFFTDLSLSLKGSRIFSIKKRSLFQDSLPLKSTERFLLNVIFNTIDFGIQILISSAVVVLFLFDMSKAIDIIFYVPFIFIHALFYGSISRSFVLVDIDLRRLESPLKSLAKKLAGLFLVGLTCLAASWSVILFAWFFIDYEFISKVKDFVETPAFIVTGVLLMDIVTFKNHVQKEAYASEHSTKKLAAKDFDHLIKYFRIKAIVSVSAACLLTLLAYNNVGKSSTFYYSFVYFDSSPDESIHSILRKESSIVAINKIKNKEFWESEMKWVTQRNVYSWIISSDKLEVLKGVTSSNKEEMTKMICANYETKNCTLKDVAALALSKKSKKIMSYLSEELSKKDLESLLKRSIKKCNTVGIDFYSKKLKIGLVEKSLEGKSVMGLILDKGNKSCLRKVKKTLL